jgi:hypothetical protein
MTMRRRKKRKTIGCKKKEKIRRNKNEKNVRRASHVTKKENGNLGLFAAGIVGQARGSGTE